MIFKGIVSYYSEGGGEPLSFDKTDKVPVARFLLTVPSFGFYMNGAVVKALGSPDLPLIIFPELLLMLVLNRLDVVCIIFPPEVSIVVGYCDLLFS